MSLLGQKSLLTTTFCEENFKYFCSGTFARVCLCRHKTSSNFFALKILSLHDVIRLKQVDHVKNEKNILKVPSPHPQSGVTLQMATGSLQHPAA